MSDAVISGFVRATQHYELPMEFGLYSSEANAAVRAALSKYITSASAKAHELGLGDMRDRREAFQNSGVKADEGDTYYDDFFGHIAL